MNAARRRLLGLGITLISLSAVLWGAWPAGRSQRELEVSPQALQQPGPGGENTARLKLEWPQVLRTGDSGIVQLAVDLDRPAQTSLALSGQPAEYNRLVEAHLELEGLQADPEGEITAPLKAGETAVLQWALHPQQAGAFTGTLWVHVRFVPREGSAPTQGVRRVLTAQRLELRSTRLLGLDGEQARLIGIAGLIAGVMIFLQTFKDFTHYA
jgi:hypothetical protein